jgi:hypothetical protein
MARGCRRGSGCCRRGGGRSGDLPPEEPGLAAADATVGLAFIGLGVVAWQRRPSSRSGLLMVATGLAWFVGSFADAALFLHRGPFVHLLVGYPRGRPRSRLEQLVVAAAYADGAVYPLARQDAVTIVLAVTAAAVLVGYLRAGGPERRARAAALAATAAVVLVLGLGALGRIVGAGTAAAWLWAYQGVLVLVAVGLFADLLWGRWTQATITGLVVDLGEPEQAGTLRAKLARAVGDPSLLVAYRLPDADGYVDEAGWPVALPAAGANRAVTYLHQGGRQIGALVHDPAVLDDPDLVSAAAAAAGVALANVRLQAEVRARVAEVEASRRRIVEASDAQRRRLERELRQGAERRLAHVTELLGDRGALVAGVQRELQAARAALTEFARGVHPRTLTEAGLAAALAELRAQCPVPVQVSVPEQRLGWSATCTTAPNSAWSPWPSRCGSLGSELTPISTRRCRRRRPRFKGLEELRELAHGLYPAALTEEGLGAALEALAEQTPSLLVLGQLPHERFEPKVEAAAYFVVAETLKRSRPQHAASTPRAPTDGWWSRSTPTGGRPRS